MVRPLQEGVQGILRVVRDELRPAHLQQRLRDGGGALLQHGDRPIESNEGLLEVARACPEASLSTKLLTTTFIKSRERLLFQSFVSQ